MNLVAILVSPVLVSTAAVGSLRDAAAATVARENHHSDILSKGRNATLGEGRTTMENKMAAISNVAYSRLHHASNTNDDSLDVFANHPARGEKAEFENAQQHTSSRFLYDTAGVADEISEAAKKVSPEYVIAPFYDAKEAASDKEKDDVTIHHYEDVISVTSHSIDLSSSAPLNAEDKKVMTKKKSEDNDGGFTPHLPRFLDEEADNVCESVSRVANGKEYWTNNSRKQPDPSSGYTCMGVGDCEDANRKRYAAVVFANIPSMKRCATECSRIEANTSYHVGFGYTYWNQCECYYENGQTPSNIEGASYSEPSPVGAGKIAGSSGSSHMVCFKLEPSTSDASTLSVAFSAVATVIVSFII